MGEGRNFTPEDGFFLTFLGAWMSTRSSMWSGMNSVRAVLLIMCILCYAMLVAQLREYISKGRERTVIHTSTILSLVLLVGLGVYFIVGTKGFFTSQDVILLISLALVWAGLLGLDYFDDKVFLKIERKSEYH